MKSIFNLVLVATLVGLCSATCHAGDPTEAYVSAYLATNTPGINGSSSFSWFVVGQPQHQDGYVDLTIDPHAGTLIFSGPVSGTITNGSNSTVSGTAIYDLYSYAFAKTANAKAIAMISLGSASITATANGPGGYDNKQGYDNIIITQLPPGQSLSPESGMFSAQVKEP